MMKLRDKVLGTRRGSRAAAVGAVALLFNLAAPHAAQAAPRTADLEIRVMSYNWSALVGEEFTYEMTIDNRGPDEASRVTFIDSIPPELTLVSATATQGTCSVGANTRCDLGTLETAGTVDVVVTVRAAQEGEVTYSASTTSQRTDPDTSNNTSSVDTTISSSYEDEPDAALCSGGFQRDSAGYWSNECFLTGGGGTVSIAGSVADPIPYGGCQGYPACVYPYLNTVQLEISLETLDGTILASCTDIGLSTGSASCAADSPEPIGTGVDLVCKARAWDSSGHALVGRFNCVTGP